MGYVRNKHRKIISLLLTFLLLFGLPISALAGEAEDLAEIKQLLQDSYVDTIPQSVLEAGTISELLKRLGDPSTEYMTRQEEQEFINSLDLTLVGIGVEQEASPLGSKVVNVLKGYGAEQAGLLPGDVITEADGVSLAGQTVTFNAGKLRGIEGTTVQLKVLRGSQILTFPVIRMKINLPLVEGKMLQDHIGYIQIHSFGSETVTLFDQEARALQSQGADSWIIDLRNNGGGYTQGALDLLGYLIGGGKTAVRLKDRTPLSTTYATTKQSYTLVGPMVLLTNQYTGSSSEITTAALKEHLRATVIGEKTYGSGRVKAMIPLASGNYLKMTIYRFFTPVHDLPIDQNGIAPHIALGNTDELATALLLFKEQNQAVAKSTTGNKVGYLQLLAGPGAYALSVNEMRKTENWAASQKILDSAYVTTTLKWGSAEGWKPFPEVWLNERYKIYFPDYPLVGDLSGIPLNKTFKVTYTRAMDWSTVANGSIELIDTVDGKRIPVKTAFVDEKVMTVTPEVSLAPDRTYYLVIHPTVKDTAGKLTTGGLALARTVK